MQLSGTAVVNLGPPSVDMLGVRAGDRNRVHCVLQMGGKAMDITGMTLKAQARLSRTTPATALEAVFTVTDAALGEFTMRWPGDAVRTLLGPAEKWQGVWDLQVTQPPDDPVTVCAGKFTAEADVTR